MKTKLLLSLVAALAVSHQSEAGHVVHPQTGTVYLSSEQSVTFAQAVALADSVGGTLVVFDNLEELNFVRTAFGRTEQFWLGADEVGGQYYWMDGRPMAGGFAYWGAANPTPIPWHGVVFNAPDSRGITRGGFDQRPVGSLFRAIIEMPNASASIGRKSTKRSK